MSEDFSFKPIGFVRSEDKREDLGVLHRNEKKRRKAVIEILPEFAQGLKDVGGYSHLYIIFTFHRSKESHLTAHPPWDDTPRGVFSTRSPHRPNALGLTIVDLLKLEGNKLFVRNVDMIDGTPVLDIKPYTSSDIRTDIEEGWLKEARKWHDD